MLSSDPAYELWAKMFLSSYVMGFSTVKSDAIIPCLRQETYMRRHMH